MSDFYNEALRGLAKRSNTEMMSPVDAFVQGFLMGRKYADEANVQLHNSILREMRERQKFGYSDDNYWENTIKRQDEELMELKSKYVWRDDE